MSLGTSFALTVPVNHEIVFMAVRRLIGIPTEHPFTVEDTHWGDARIVSEPWRTPLFLLYHRNGRPIGLYDDQPDAPVTYVGVSLDSNLSSTGPNGEDCTALHHRLTAELGAWCDAEGLEWWTRGEWDNVWRQGVPAYSKEMCK